MIAFKTYRTTCPYCHKPVEVRVEFEPLNVCGDPQTYYKKMGYRCSIGSMYGCEWNGEDSSDCPIFKKSEY